METQVSQKNTPTKTSGYLEITGVLRCTPLHSVDCCTPLQPTSLGRKSERPPRCLEGILWGLGLKGDPNHLEKRGRMAVGQKWVPKTEQVNGTQD